MKLHAPQYYANFHCIANKCVHNCCKAGWEIDIDNKTAEEYKKVKGQFGEKLRMNIDWNSPQKFIMDKHSNCPFLNENNLCDIITTLGENSLCQICTDHPRFYEWFGNVKECGIGLCCEEAARIILSQNTPFSTIEYDIPDEDTAEYNAELYQYLYNARKDIINYLDNHPSPITSNICDVLWYAYTLQQNIDSGLLDAEEIFEVRPYATNGNLENVLEFFLALEPNDKNWITYLNDCMHLCSNTPDKISNFDDANPQVSTYLKNISIYFVWRYFLKGVFDEDIVSKISLMAICVAVIKVLFYCKWLESGNITLNDCVEIVRQFSEEVEYSEENLEKLEEACYTNEYFSVENIINLLDKLKE